MANGVKACPSRALACTVSFIVFVAVLSSAAAPPAWGAEESDAAVQDATQILYRQALQSIAEGRKNDASTILHQVVQAEPEHAGAWLDLALIQCSLGNRNEAERLFRQIETRFDPPPGIQTLITDARLTGCSQWQAVSQLNLSLGRGHSSNVNQGSTGVLDTGLGVELPLLEEFQPRADSYTVLTGDYMRDISSNGATAFAQFQLRRHDHLGDYDTGALFLGVESPWRRNGWTMRGSAVLALITLGGQFYQHQAQLQGRISPPLPLPRGMQFDLVGSISHVQYRRLSNFDGITGELRSQFTWRNEGSYMSASAGRLVDHATSGDRPGGDRHGWLVNTSWRYRLPQDVVGELGYSRQAWTGASAYASGIIDAVRHQNTSTWRTSLSWPMARNHNLVLEGRFLKNRENIGIFSYSDRQLQLSWQWQRP